MPRLTHTWALDGHLLRAAMQAALCTLALLIAAAPALAGAPSIEEPEWNAEPKQKTSQRFSWLDSPIWLSVAHGEDAPERTLRIDELYGASGGRYASDLVAVFKLKLDEIFTPGRRLPFITNFFRPYVLGGKDSIRVSPEGSLGRVVPGSESCTALHIGGGGDFQLSRQFVLSLDFSQVLHSGSLGQTDYQKLNAGLRFLY